MHFEAKEIRRIIEAKFEEILDTEKRKVMRLERLDAYGHEAGIPIEEWVKDCLEEIDWGIHVYFPNEFLENFFSNIDSEEGKLKEALQQPGGGLSLGEIGYLLLKNR